MIGFVCVVDVLHRSSELLRMVVVGSVSSLELARFRIRFVDVLELLRLFVLPVLLPPPTVIGVDDPAPPMPPPLELECDVLTPVMLPPPPPLLGEAMSTELSVLFGGKSMSSF